MQIVKFMRGKLKEIYKKERAIAFAQKRDRKCKHIVDETIQFYLDKEHSFERELDYIKKNGYAAFPYDFYDYRRVIHQMKVGFDEEGEMFVYAGNNKLYTDLVTYAQLVLEQDPDSPHCYFDTDFCVKEGDVFVDVGAAEGLISLNVLQKASKIYIIEGDQKWISDLERTFSNHKDKVIIIPKFAGDVDNDGMITLDKLLENEAADCFIKIDVEGAERQVLRGMTNILRRNQLKIALCTYHNFEDQKEFEAILKKYGFLVEYTKGYLYKKEPPYFAKGLIKAQK